MLYLNIAHTAGNAGDTNIFKCGNAAFVKRKNSFPGTAKTFPIYDTVFCFESAPTLLVKFLVPVPVMEELRRERIF